MRNSQFRDRSAKRSHNFQTALLSRRQRFVIVFERARNKCTVALSRKMTRRLPDRFSRVCADQLRERAINNGHIKGLSDLSGPPRLSGATSDTWSDDAVMSTAKSVRARGESMGVRRVKGEEGW